MSPDLPVSIERIIQKTLEKEPAVRFQSAGELLAALDEVVVTDVMPGAPTLHLNARCPYRGLSGI